jgi:hypothetical protein
MCTHLICISLDSRFSLLFLQVAGLPIKIRSRMNSAYVRESPGPTARGSYLKSDDISESPKVEEAMKMLRRLRLLSDDPRSPSVGILRTPIQVRIIFERCSSHHTTGLDIRIHMGLGPREHAWQWQTQLLRPQSFHVQLWPTWEGITWRCPWGCGPLKCP